jgi:hypothetical protein
MTVRGVINRILTVVTAVAVALVVTLGFAPAAGAAPKVKLTAITVTGDKMDKLTVEAAKSAANYELLLSEVSWLANATPQTSAPKKNKLGPKFTVTVLAGDKPQQVYNLYPLATGGPRAHRPAKQPTGKKKDGWFFGRLSMSEALRISGVPLEARQDVLSGGIGGGLGENVAAESKDPMDAVNGYIGQFQQLFLLNGAVLVVVLFGLAGVAFLIRRRV